MAAAEAVDQKQYQQGTENYTPEQAIGCRAISGRVLQQ
jgi:hypothetical protein